MIPGTILSKTPPTRLAQLDAAGMRGREVYVGEGARTATRSAGRPLAQDRVWGRPSRAGDYAFSTPQLLGSERTGPDLSNVGARQPSEVWHSIHLYEPRASCTDRSCRLSMDVRRQGPADAPGDVVGAFRRSTRHRGKSSSPREEQDLVAYLKSLKQPSLPSPRHHREQYADGNPSGGDLLGDDCRNCRNAGHPL